MASNQFERVAGILRKATYTSDTKDKLECLLQVRELIINYDRSLLDSFFEEVVAFQHYPNNELRRFVIKFIEDACITDPCLISKSVTCLSHLFSLSLHSDPPLSGIIRAIIGTMKTIYSRSLTRAVKLGFVESGAVTGGGIEAGSLADTSLEAFRSVVAFKDEIIRLLLPSSIPVAPCSSFVPPPPSISTRLCANLTDAARIDIVKFIEAIVIQQSRRTSHSDILVNSTELTLDQIPDMPNSLLKNIVGASSASSSATPLPGICLIRPRRLADEAERLIAGLMKLPLMQGDDISLRSIVTGPVFDALIDTLMSIARQRPQFLNEVVQSFETIHVNLPPHFTQAQVSSARRKLKSALLSLLQHSATNTEYQSRIIILLTDLGATQQEISGVLPIKPLPPSTLPSSFSKRGRGDSQFRGLSTMENEEDEEEEEEELMRVAKRSRIDPASTTPSIASMTKETIPSIEEIAIRLVPKLTSANVADLVLLSMVTLPSQMPAAFDATYTPIAAAGTATQVRHLARLLAAQLVVWATDTAGGEVANRENCALLSQLLAENNTERWEYTGSAAGGVGIDAGDDESSIKKPSIKRDQKMLKRTSEKADEDDEAAFMKEHAARMHTTAKPMNISVVRGTIAAEEATPPPPAAFNLAIPPAPMLSSTGTTPARPFSLDAVIAPLPPQLRQGIARDAFSRILAFECASRSRSGVEESSRVITSHSADLPPREAARVKLLCRLPPNRRLASNYHYPLLITQAMDGLKEGFELLTNLLMHEYTAFRGFRLVGVLEDALTKTKVEASDTEGDANGDDYADDEGEDADEARRLLLESQRQLMALRAREGAETVANVQEARVEVDTVEEEMQAMTTSAASASASLVFGKNGLQDFGSLAVYDALFTDILTRFVESGIKSACFGRLLLEAPLLTANAIEVLKRYCTLPEQAAYGFEVLRSLIEMRPTQRREELLSLLLGFCAFEEPTVRRAALKATCQLADSNSLWEKLVEDRAIERLKYVLRPQPTGEMFEGLMTKPPPITSQWTDETCQLCAHLFLGLLPRNPGKLLLTLADVYVAAADGVRRCLLRLMDTSVCEIGLHSPHLLHLLDNCPSGAETLVTRMIHILTDPRTAFAHVPTPSQPQPLPPAPPTPAPKTASRSISPHGFASAPPIMPPSALVDRVRRLYRERIRDVRCLIPVIVGLTKQEVIAVLPQLVQLNEKVVKEVLGRLLHASVATQPAPNPSAPEGISKAASKDPVVVGPVTPEELLVAIHLLEFVKDPNATMDQPSKKPYVEIRVILQACLHCFAERALYTQERLSAAIGQLLDRPVVPTLFLRTVMQALALYPRLTGYVINVLFRLIQKQVWKSEVLWDGFIRCCVKTQPQSYQVLLQLPPQQLQSVFTREPNLRTQVRRYVDNFSSAQRTHISRAVFEVLERETSPPPQPSADATVAETAIPGSAKDAEREAEGRAEAALSSGSATPLHDEVIQARTPSPTGLTGLAEGQVQARDLKKEPEEETNVEVGAEEKEKGNRVTSL